MPKFRIELHSKVRVKEKYKSKRPELTANKYIVTHVYKGLDVNKKETWFANLAILTPYDELVGNIRESITSCPIKFLEEI